MTTSDDKSDAYPEIDLGDTPVEEIEMADEADEADETESAEETEPAEEPAPAEKKFSWSRLVAFIVLPAIALLKENLDVVNVGFRRHHSHRGPPFLSRVRGVRTFPQFAQG